DVTAAGDDENPIGPVGGDGVVHIETVETHLLAALANVDDTVDRPADGALALDESPQRIDRQGLAQRCDLDKSENALRGNYGPRRSDDGLGLVAADRELDLDVGVEVERLQFHVE